MLYSLVHRGRAMARVTTAVFVAWLMLIGPAAYGVIDTDTACPDPPNAGFQDIADYPSSIRDAINCLADYEITKGTSSTTFSPEDGVTRWQMALFLIRQADVLDIDLPSGSNQGFTDIAELPLATRTAINQLVQLGITTGTSALTFSPFDVVTREQMALFITRLVAEAGLDLPSGSDQGFTDIGVLPSATERAINQLVQLDIVEGLGGSLYGPFGEVNRWQMALFLTRTMEASGIEPIVPAPPSPSPKVGAPDLERVVFDRDDDDETRLRFEFDEPVSTLIEEGEFWIVGWDGTLVNPNDAGRSSDHSDIVLADFDNEDYDNAVAAVVTIGAVFDIDSLENTIGSYPLHDVTVDSVDWPVDRVELVGVDEFDSSGDTVEFEFDQDVDTPIDASAFYLVEQDGTVHFGDAIDDVTDEIVVVDFSVEGLSTDEWNDVVRAFVEEGAVEPDGGGLGNLPVSVDVSNSGRSDTPYLTGVDITDVDEGIVVFEFSEDLVDFDGTSGNFQVVLHDGTVYTSTDEARDDDAKDEVVVEFNGGAALDSDIVIYATALDEAVTEFSGASDDSAPDTYSMSYRFNGGDTAGPDLESSRGTKSGLDDDTYTIVLTFDEDVDTAFDPATELFGWDEEGEFVDIDGGTLTIDDDVIEIEFDGTDDGLEELVDGDVVRFGILADQVTDEWGFSSYPDGVGVDQTK